MNLIYKENGEEEEKAATNDNLEKMIIDCGTTKSVTGQQWMDYYLSNLSEEERENVHEKDEERFFRFGNSVTPPRKK